MSKYNRVRMTPEQRKLQILDAAVGVALDQGVYAFSIANVSRAIQDRHCSKATIKHYFSTMENLRTAVIEKAIKDDHGVIVAQAIAMNHDAVNSLDSGQRRKYLKCAL